jgi:hypothetical protein
MRFFRLSLVHIVQNLTDDQFLELGDENFGEFVRVDVSKEIVRINLAGLTLEQNFDHLECGYALDNDVISCIFLEGEPIDEVLEGEDEVRLLHV